MSAPDGFAAFTPYEARWRYSDPDLGGVSMSIVVRGRPNVHDDVLCRVGSRTRAADLLIPLGALAASDEDGDARIVRSA